MGISFRVWIQSVSYAKIPTCLRDDLSASFISKTREREVFDYKEQSWKSGTQRRTYAPLCAVWRTADAITFGIRNVWCSWKGQDFGAATRPTLRVINQNTVPPPTRSDLPKGLSRRVCAICLCLQSSASICNSRTSIAIRPRLSYIYIYYY